MSRDEPADRAAPGDDALTEEDRVRALRDGVLLGQECGACGHTTATAAAACVRCGSRDRSVVELPAEGEVHVVTTIHVPPAGFESPYRVGLVSLGADGRLTARIDGDAEIGDPVSFEDVVELTGGPVPVFR